MPTTTLVFAEHGLPDAMQNKIWELRYLKSVELHHMVRHNTHFALQRRVGPKKRMYYVTSEDIPTCIWRFNSRGEAATFMGKLAVVMMCTAQGAKAGYTKRKR